MLDNVSEKIHECCRQAEDCARQAAAQTNPKLREDLIDTERRWLDLARAYEFAERVAEFTLQPATGLQTDSDAVGDHPRSFSIWD